MQTHQLNIIDPKTVCQVYHIGKGAKGHASEPKLSSDTSVCLMQLSLHVIQ